MQTAEPPSPGQAPVSAAPAGLDLSDRREGDRALRYWRERETLDARAGLNLDIALPDGWAHCFVLLPKPEIEQSLLLAYGGDFAHAFGLPREAVPPVPIAGKLPRRILEIFLHGCTAARQQDAAVRDAGELVREDGRRELYRAVFIPIREANREPRVFGSFNSKPVDDAANAAVRLPPQPAPSGFWQRLTSGLFRSRS